MTLSIFRDRSFRYNLRAGLVTAVVLAFAFLLGRRASLLWIGLLVAGMGGLILLTRPALQLPILVVAALAVPVWASTGTEVRPGTAALLVPALAALWLVDALLKRQASLPAARSFWPLVLFLLSGIFSLLIGNATWDPMVPRPGNFLLVQLAQWTIFTLSGIAFGLMASWARSGERLRSITLTYLLIGGITTILWSSPARPIISPLLAVSPGYPPLLVLLGTLAAAELLYDRQISSRWRWFLAAVLIVVAYQTMVGQRESVSTLVGVLSACGALIWLRFRNLRWVTVLLALVLTLSGLLLPAAWEFVGGDAEWELSGGSRLALSGRVIEATMRNPITGLGPAAYRPYTRTKPLPYGTAYWIEPQISSHNNYVDLFSHVGLLGSGLFLWFMIEVARLGMRLRRSTTGFALGYTNAMLATWIGILPMMAFGDWFLPFIYNLGFPAFQGSVLVWMFLGGLVALDNMQSSPKEEGKRKIED